MKKRMYYGFLAGLVSLIYWVTSVQAETLGFVLPFTGTVYISNAPGEGLHVNASSEAIDYAPNGCITVRAPYNGTVVDVISVADFGTVVRIDHFGFSTSFFAHLDPNNIYVTSQQNVTQGQAIALSGDSGTGGEGCHLHYESRTGAVAGDVYSGQSEPVRAVPGNWFNTWYSPPPNFRCDPDRFSGGAQNPDAVGQPSTMGSTGRHLANTESPDDEPTTHLTNVQDTSVTFHGGGSPSTPGTYYETWFQFQHYVYGRGWEAPYGSYTLSPVLTMVKDSTNQCDPNGQHCHEVWSRNSLRDWSTLPRVIEFWTGNSSERRPHISAAYDYYDSTTVLEYYTPGADFYNVYEYHDGSGVQHTYSGLASSIRVERRAGTNLYIVQAHYTSDGYWSPWSIWLIVHW
jgi:murein DD-endopeptidase MepM/ murein hydrolase activator NlpD